MDRHNESYQASPFLENLTDGDVTNPFGSGPVPQCDRLEAAEEEQFQAAPLRFKPGTTIEIAESIHRYAQIFGGGSVKLVGNGDDFQLILMETRDRQLLLDQFREYLT